MVCIYITQCFFACKGSDCKKHGPPSHTGRHSPIVWGKIIWPYFLSFFVATASHEISDGVKSSARAAQAAEVGMRRMGAIAAAQTICKFSWGSPPVCSCISFLLADIIGVFLFDINVRGLVYADFVMCCMSTVICTSRHTVGSWWSYWVVTAAWLPRLMNVTGPILPCRRVSVLCPHSDRCIVLV